MLVGDLLMGLAGQLFATSGLPAAYLVPRLNGDGRSPNAAKLRRRGRRKHPSIGPRQPRDLQL
jgi:hypothetical protein